MSLYDKEKERNRVARWAWLAAFLAVTCAAFGGYLIGRGGH